MARIAILMVSEPGHLLPTMRFARSLTSAGHSVCYLAVPQFRQFIVEQGFDFCTILSGLCCHEECDDVFIVHESGDSIDRKITAAGPSALASILGSLSTVQADLIICDSVIGRYFGKLIAQECSANVVMCATSLPGAVDPPLPEIVMCPGELEIPSALRPAPLRHYAEPSIFRRQSDPQFSWKRIDREKALVYCSLGTQIAEYSDAEAVLSNIAAAFDLLTDLQLVLVGGLAYKAVTRVRLPPNVVVLRSAPQLELLQRARIAITHGGLGTVKEAIMAQVPMLVIPFLHDQPANAERVKYHRLGLVCAPAECSSDRIRGLISDLMADEVAQNGVGVMSRVFSQYEAQACAFSLLQSFLA